jgi:hypothetical protein
MYASIGGMCKHFVPEQLKYLPKIKFKKFQQKTNTVFALV